MAKIKLVVIESPNPIDLFDGRSESEGLVSACKLIGHQGISFFAKSREEFKEICQYISSANTKHASRNPSAPLFLHLSCHGNKTGISFGSTDLTWKDLVHDVEPILNNSYYEGNFAISISSCGSGEHDIDEHILDRIEIDDSIKIPQYIFSIPGRSVNWDDALVGWILFYHKLSNIKLGDKTNVQAALKEICKVTRLHFSYHRYDEKDKDYKTFTP
ncbi:MAG: hypothetical protein HQK55_09865 [Deltaproteobacteria bacterium]|nr:hypothetical protein [Deltaproteobacteria bacterium]